MLIRTFLLTAALAVFVPVGQAATPPVASATQSAFQWDARIVRGELPNGLRYFLIPDQDPKQRVQLQLMVRAGSLDETDAQSGVAHMVEHMAFHESRDFPQGIHNYGKTLGWRVGEHFNAVTNFERTLYMLTPARNDQWDQALHVLSQMAGGAQITEGSLAGERQIILEEWRGKLGVAERMDRQRRALLRAGSLYPNRPTIGTETSIRKQPASSLRRFYADWYRPNNMAVLVAGHFDPQQVEARIRHWFGAQVAAPLPERHSRDPQLTPGLRIARMQDAESGSSQVGWVFRFTSNNEASAAGLRERLIDQITDHLIGERIREIRTSLPGGVESLVSAKGDIGGRTQTLAFSTRVTVDGHAQGQTLILQTIERLRRDGLSRDAFEKKREEYRQINARGQIASASRDPQRWLSLLNEALDRDRVVQDPAQKQAMIAAALDSITLADTEARLRQWLASSDQLLFMIAPGLSPLTLPTEAAVRAEISRIAAKPLPVLTQPKAAPAASALVWPAATPGEITGEAREDQVLIWQLGNGDRFIWLQRPNTSQRLFFAANSAAGYRLPGVPGWQAQIAQQIAQQSDPAGWPEGALAQWAQSQKISLFANQNDARLNYSASIKAEQWADLARLYRVRQSAVALQNEAVTASMQTLARQIARDPSSTKSRQAEALAALRFDRAKEDRQPDPQALRQVDAARLHALWQMQTRAPVTYYLSGEADEAAVREVVERELAGIARDPAFNPAQALPLASGRKETTLAIGLEPQAAVQARGAIAMSWSPERAMAISALSRTVYRALRAELREKENGIYRLRFSMTLNPASQQLETEIDFTADPARLAALWQSAQAILAQPGKHLDEATLQGAVKQMQSSEQERLKDDQSWFTRLQLSFERYGDSRYLTAVAKLGESLDTASLRALAGELDLTRDLASVLLYPHPKAH